jgi:hypothetical protein
MHFLVVDATDTSPLVTAKLVLGVCEPAFFPAAPLLRPRILRAIRQARRTLRRADPEALSTPRELRSAASAAATAAAALTIATGSNRDEVLVDLLADALATYRATTRRDPDHAEILGTCRIICGSPQGGSPFSAGWSSVRFVGVTAEAGSRFES